MIYIKDLFDKANSIVGISQKEFLTSFNEALLQLNARYGEKFVFMAGVATDATSVEDTIGVYPEWRSAILNYVIYLKTGDQVRKGEYDSSMDYAYRTIWKRRMGKTKRYRVTRWY